MNIHFHSVVQFQVNIVNKDFLEFLKDLKETLDLHYQVQEILLDSQLVAQELPKLDDSVRAAR